MNKLLTLLLLSLVLFYATPVVAQSLPAAESISDFWPMGERRVYKFYSDSAKLGYLKALMYGGRTSGTGAFTAWKMQENLVLSLAYADFGVDMQVDNMHIFDTVGVFISADMEVRMEDRQEKIQMRFDPKAGKISARRGAEEMVESELEIKAPVYAYDPYMVDQLSFILARHDLNIGETFEVPVFSPQGLYFSVYEFKVIDKVAISNTPLADSVWQVDILKPVRQSAYLDKHNRLIQLRDHDTKIVAELAWVDPPVGQTPKKSKTEAVSDFRDLLPQYGLYLLVTLVGLAFLGRGAFNQKWAYLLFVAGALSYLLIYITHDPIQRYYGQAFLESPAASLNLLGIPPALISGLIQQTLVLIPLFLLARMTKPGVVLLVALGAFAGAGFGFYEACQTSLANDRLLKIVLAVNQMSAILFHTAAGAMLGYGLARRKIWQFFLITVGLNALGHYMVLVIGTARPTFDTIKNLTTFKVFYSLALFAVMFMVQLRLRKQTAKSKKGRR